MKCDFVVGQRVVMVTEYDAQSYARAASEGVTLPTKGSIYTVRGIEPGAGWQSNLTFIWLDELSNPPSCDGIEPNWDTNMFRPVVERKTDISIFTAMLTPAGRIPVDA